MHGLDIGFMLDAAHTALGNMLSIHRMVALWAGVMVGLAIGLLQALTSVQEMTLTFVPKLGAILAVFWVTMSFSGATLVRLYQDQIIPMVIGP